MISCQSFDVKKMHVLDYKNTSITPYTTNRLTVGLLGTMLNAARGRRERYNALQPVDYKPFRHTNAIGLTIKTPLHDLMAHPPPGFPAVMLRTVSPSLDNLVQKNVESNYMHAPLSP